MFKSSWDILALGNLNHWSGCLSTVSYVSLGCPKALVDSEHIVTALADENFEVVGENRTLVSQIPVDLLIKPKRKAMLPSKQLWKMNSRLL